MFVYNNTGDKIKYLEFQPLDGEYEDSLGDKYGFTNELVFENNSTKVPESGVVVAVKKDCAVVTTCIGVFKTKEIISYNHGNQFLFQDIGDDSGCYVFDRGGEIMGPYKDCFAINRVENEEYLLVLGDDDKILKISFDGICFNEIPVKEGDFDETYRPILMKIKKKKADINSRAIILEKEI